MYSLVDTTTGDYKGFSSTDQGHDPSVRAVELAKPSKLLFKKPQINGTDDGWVETATAQEVADAFELRKARRHQEVDVAVAERFKAMQNNPVLDWYMSHAYKILGEEAFDVIDEATPGKYEAKASRDNAGSPQRPVLEAVCARYVAEGSTETLSERAALVEVKANGMWDLFAVTEPIRQWHGDQVAAATTDAELDTAWAAFILDLDTQLPLPA
jgi:hypothetical protein